MHPARGCPKEPVAEPKNTPRTKRAGLTAGKRFRSKCRDFREKVFFINLEMLHCVQHDKKYF
jgi:hypothetical protein